jgi:hypothetical protein
MAPRRLLRSSTDLVLSAPQVGQRPSADGVTAGEQLRRRQRTRHLRRWCRQTSERTPESWRICNREAGGSWSGLDGSATSLKARCWRLTRRAARARARRRPRLDDPLSARPDRGVPESRAVRGAGPGDSGPRRRIARWLRSGRAEGPRRLHGVAPRLGQPAVRPPHLRPDRRRARTHQPRRPAGRRWAVSATSTQPPG